MSLQQVIRAQIAEACTQVVTVDGREYMTAGRALPPDTISPLDVWPVWQRTTLLTRCAHEITWHVLVALPPTDQGTYVQLADAFTDAFGDTLQFLGKVVAVTPTQIVGSDTNAPIPCLQFELTT